MSVPVKKIYGKCAPTIQSQFWTGKEKRYTLLVRLSESQLQALRNLQNLCATVAFWDYTTLIDYVWIENINPFWEGDEHLQKPWATWIVLHRV